MIDPATAGYAIARLFNMYHLDASKYKDLEEELVLILEQTQTDNRTFVAPQRDSVLPPNGANGYCTLRMVALNYQNNNISRSMLPCIVFPIFPCINPSSQTSLNGNQCLNGLIC